MKKLYLIDMRFSETGHYVDDLLEFEFLKEKYEITYLPNGNMDTDRLKHFNVISSINQFVFYIRLYIFMLFSRRTKIIFLSCSYIQLLIISILSFNFSYFFRFHCMPSVRVNVYKFVIKILAKLSNGIIVLDYPVRDFLIESKLIKSKNIFVVIGRTLDVYNFIPNDFRKEFNLTFIGALNDEKEIDVVLSALLDNEIVGLNLRFYSKGIQKYKNIFERLKLLYPSIEVYDGFLPRDEYDKIINMSDALILPYRIDYGVRFSAVLNDAFRCGKKALTVNLPQFQYYKIHYNACELYSDVSGVVKAIERLMSNSDPVSRKIIEDYSQKKKIAQLKMLGI